MDSNNKLPNILKLSSPFLTLYSINRPNDVLPSIASNSDINLGILKHIVDIIPQGPLVFIIYAWQVGEKCRFSCYLSF